MDEAEESHQRELEESVKKMIGEEHKSAAGRKAANVSCRASKQRSDLEENFFSLLESKLYISSMSIRNISTAVSYLSSSTSVLI